MSIRTSAKKVAIAAIMVAPLTLVACGSDDEDTTASSTTTQSSTTRSSTTTTEETTTEEVTEETTTEEVAPEPSTQPPAESPAPAPAPAAVNDPVITYEELAPVDSGQPANPEDAAAIDSLIRGALAPTTVRSMLQYVPDNTCNRVIEASGGRAAMDFSMYPDVPLNQIPGATTGTVDSVSDVIVKGDSASAWVVASAQGKTDSGTQRFLREDGRWKFCD